MHTGKVEIKPLHESSDLQRTYLGLLAILLSDCYTQSQAYGVWPVDFKHRDYLFSLHDRFERLSRAGYGVTDSLRHDALLTLKVADMTVFFLENAHCTTPSAQLRVGYSGILDPRI